LSVYELIGYPLTDSMEQGLSSEAGSHSAIQEIPHLLWNQKFITAFTRAHHWSLSWTRCIQATPSNPISLQSVLYFPLPKLFQRNCPSLRPFVTFCNKLDFMVKSCWLFAQPPSCRTTSYHLSVTTYGYPPYLEAVLSIHNLRMYHAMVMDPHDPQKRKLYSARQLILCIEGAM
jgi:hypothetical protein